MADEIPELPTAPEFPTDPEFPTAPSTYQGSCLPSPPPSEGSAEPNATSWKPKGFCDAMVFVTILVFITFFVAIIIQSLEDTKNPHARHYGITAGILLGVTLSFLCFYLWLRIFRQQETRLSQFLRLLGRAAYRIMEREDDDETDDGGNATGTAAATAETETDEQKAGNTGENAESLSEPSGATETAEPKSTEKSEIQQPPVVETQSTVDKLSKLAAEVSEILDQSLLQVELSKSAMESGMQSVEKVSATKTENGAVSKGLSSNSVSRQKTEMEP